MGENLQQLLEVLARDDDHSGFRFVGNRHDAVVDMAFRRVRTGSGSDRIKWIGLLNQ